MKQTLLLGVALGLSFSALAQSSSRQVDPRLPEAVRSKSFKLVDPVDNGQVIQAVAPNLLVASSRSTRGTTIGNTTYDATCNRGTPGNQLARHADGSLSAIWIFSATGNTAAPDRGTGYNYKPAGGAFGAIPTVRAEVARTGWPNIASVGAGEAIVAHAPLNISTCAAKGTCASGAWAEAAIPATGTWPRMAASGNNIHVISHSNAAVGVMAGAVRYSRSQDGGVTWNLTDVVVPGSDNPSYWAPVIDGYAIDASGSTVAFVIGGIAQDLSLFKSTDNGTTWTKTVVNAFPIPNFDPATMMSDVDGDGNVDTVNVTDAGASVVIDNNGMVHVWVGRLQVHVTPGSVEYEYGIDGLLYWNESKGASTPGNQTAVQIAQIEDRDGDGLINILGPADYACGLTGMPSGGVDANGNLYLVYSSQMENTTNGAAVDPESYRNVYYMYSTDNGATWSTPLNVTPSDFDEAVYPIIPRRIGSTVDMIHHLDNEPGRAVSNNDPFGVVDIVYDSWPSVSGITNNSIVEKFEVYPNPTNSVAKIAISVTQAETIKIKVSNILGQEVETISQELTNAGNHLVNLNVAKYSAGMYLINATVGSETFSKKLMVN